MTLSAPALVTSASSTADSSTYNTGSVAGVAGSLVLVFFSSGKAANLSEVPTGLSQNAAGGMGALTLVGAQAIPNNNQTVSVWKGIGTAVAGPITATHAGVMDNAIWHVVRFTSDVATPTVRQFKTRSDAATGNIAQPLDVAALSGSCLLGAFGLNAGSAVVPTVGAGHTLLGSILLSTSPTTQQGVEYDATAPLSSVSWNIASTSGRSTIALEVADGTPPAPSGGATWWDGATEVPVTLSWWDGATETPITGWS